MVEVSKRRLFSEVRWSVVSLTLAACGVVGLVLSAAAASGPIVKTNAGDVEGSFQYGVNEFLGVPYAAPPVGNLRWRPPVAHNPWKGVRKAIAYGPTCAQINELGVFAGPANNNEDCLYLNVFTPNLKPSAKLPVLVWIHGGGNFDGEGSDYDGSKLALQGGTVVVTINYRLNLFGFLAIPSLDSEGHPFANYGWLDQQMVLKWVQANIANFGGDKNNVTVSGESGGATDTAVHVISPLAKGLFQHAICEEACPVNFMRLSDAETLGSAFATAAGCGALTGPPQAKCLRALPAAAIEALAGNGITYTTRQGARGATPTGMTQDTGNGPYLSPANEGVVDGTILPVQPISAWHTGNFNKPMTIINGGNEDTQNFALAFVEFEEQPRAAITQAQYEGAITAQYSAPPPAPGLPYPAGTAAAVLAHYPVTSYPSAQLAWDAAGTDPGSCTEEHVNGLIAAHAPFYAYEWDERTAPSPTPPMPGLVTLAYHTSEIQYLFPFYHGGPLGIARPLNLQQTNLSDEFVAAFTNFAHTGNPNGAGNKPWPRYTTVARNYMSLNIPSLSTLTEAQHSARHQCAFWSTILPYTNGPGY